MRVAGGLPRYGVGGRLALGIARLRDGEVCLVLPCGSGVPRAMLVCGRCQLILRGG